MSGSRGFQRGQVYNVSQEATGESMNLGGIPGVFPRMICRSNDGKLRKDWKGFLNKNTHETVICRGFFVGGIFVSGPSLSVAKR